MHIAVLGRPFTVHVETGDETAGCSASLSGADADSRGVGLAVRGVKDPVAATDGSIGAVDGRVDARRRPDALAGDALRARGTALGTTIGSGRSARAPRTTAAAALCTHPGSGAGRATATGVGNTAAPLTCVATVLR
jgi:hypothetical protein